MEIIMKHIKRIFTGLVLVLAFAVFVNYQTRFFKDISQTVPYIGTNYPKLAEAISKASDDVNELVSYIPTPREFIAMLKGTEVSISPDDIAHNTYYMSDSLLSFNPTRKISAETDGTYLTVSGITENENDRFLVYRFIDSEGNLLAQSTDHTNPQNTFGKKLTIPDNAYQFAIFFGKDRYGEFASYVYDYLLLDKDDNGQWQISTSPVYENNIAMYEKAKSKSNALKNTYAICSNEKNITAIAKSITQNTNTDYEKALKIHDWVCENIYYDSDSISENSNDAPYVASDVLKNGRAVCLGYANLYAALCRSSGIPCNVVKGYSLGVNGSNKKWQLTDEESEANHAWNEVYVDGRWVIVDTTWDSRNKISDGTKHTDNNFSHLYFDSNLKFFSQNHKILEYTK